MFNKSLFRRAALPVVAASMLLLAGCASMETGKPEEIVAKRAQAFWNARAAGQTDKAYALTPPSYRKLHTLEQFQKNFGNAFTIKDVTVVNVTCEAEKCTARAKIDVNPALAGIKISTIATHLDEIWLLEDGQWWRHQDL